ncbi:MAG TPA: hypothetical protein VGI30_11620 [Caulobacteraceae bacterium]|jgi:ElaB/YqjD/DUF883 family membrane-anchored ribosome-binding protein
MSTDTLEHATKETAASVASAIDKGQAALNEALATAQQKIAETAKVAEKALKEGAEALRVQTKAYRENASEQFDEAQRYVVDKVKERPVTAALTGLGVGLLIGLLLSSNRDR